MNDMRPSVTLLFPFDTGRTYIWPNKIDDADWQAHFPVSETSSWKTQGVLPEQFRSPFGLIAQLHLTGPYDQKLRAAVGELAQELDWIEQTGLQGDVVFFTNGAAFLILRAHLIGEVWQNWKALMRWGRKTETTLAEVANMATEEYVQHINQTKPHKLHCRRAAEYGIERLYDAYPLFFLQEKFSPVPGRQLYEAQFEDVSIQISWASAYIAPLPADRRRNIEATFLVASAVWNTVYTVDELLSDAMTKFHHQMLDRSLLQLRNKDFRQIAFTYMDTVASSYPLRWTLSERHLVLLETIHKVWNTARLWDTVTNKTALLPQYYQQLEEEEQEERNKIFALAGLFIGLFSLVSASADLIGLLPQDIIPAGLPRFLLALVFTFVGGLIAWRVLRRHWT